MAYMARFPEMKWDVSNVAEEFKLFKQRIELCLLDHNIEDKKKQATKIKIALGNEGLRRLNASGLTPLEQEDPHKIWCLFEDQLKVKVNFRIHRLELMRYKQKPDESIDEFVNRCRTKARECEFSQDELSERLVELVIASTPIEAYQKDLLDKPKGLKIEDLVDAGRKYEAILAGKQCLRTLQNGQVDSIRKDSRQCGNCGLRHPPKRCPAFRDACHACGTQGHWSAMCRKTKAKGTKPQQQMPEHSKRPKDGQDHSRNYRGKSGHQKSKSRSQEQGKSKSQQSKHPSQHRSKHVDELDVDVVQSEHEEKELHTIQVMINSIDAVQTEAMTTLNIKCPQLGGQDRLRAKIDTGASGNILPLWKLKDLYGNHWKDVLSPTRAQLAAYNNTPIPCLGSITISCQYKDSPWEKQTWYVVNVDGPVIVGLPTCRKLDVVTINEIHRSISEKGARPPIQSVRDLQQAFPKQFDRIGSFKGEATLHLKDDATPSIDPPRKCSVHVQQKLEKELDQMEKNGVIKKVDHHTDWCNSLTTALKKDGSLRICLDPRKLNQSLKRCPHKVPTLEELNPAFSQAKYFSKLDAKAGYWSVHLDEASQELTTFRSPFGRYCFRRLPFGLSVSQDIFQQRMDTIIAQVPGCVCIADDVAVFGRTEEEHDANLWRLLEVAQKEGLVFNSAKCVVKTQSINFFGSLYTSQGICPDPSKLEDVREMPSPQNKDELQRILGMMTYLSPYIPNYAEKSAILRELLKKDVPFLWHEDHEEVFQSLKSEISKGACLQYYKPSVHTVLEVDASSKGLGACLLQDGKPIAFASKSLSEAQSNYSNIERETLALVFGITRFHTYLFGSSFTVHTDHKPLEIICRKPLRSAPPRLQRLLVKIQGYDFNVLYKPGSQMTVPDALSRLPNPKKTEDVPIDLHIDEALLVQDTDDDLACFSNTKQVQLQKETSRDPTMKLLSRTIQDGWPDEIRQVPNSLRTFWSYRDELGIVNGIIFKGRQVVVPESLREDILEQLHTSHMGIERTRRLARDTVYWPGISKDIEKIVKTCQACQENQDQQHKEPLEPHDVPPTPWTKLAADLFHLDGTDFLLITDYHSKFPVIRKMHNTSSTSVSTVMREAFSMFGVPAEVVTDNGPQFSGKPFKEMCAKWNIKHTTSSPRYPRSNGLAERMVRTVKSLIKKCRQTGEDLLEAMLHLRATPQADLPSPAEMMFGRKVKTTLPGRSFGYPHTDVHDQLQQRKEKMKHDHDKHAGHELPKLSIGQRVRMLNTDDNTWIPAKVSRVCEEPRSYEVTTPNGKTLRRNRSHLREMFTSQTQHDTSSTTTPDPRRIDLDEEEIQDEEANHHTPQNTDNSERTQNIQSDRHTYTTRYGRQIHRPDRFRNHTY